jgi:tetraacyldisaccharide 4'-kinase
MTQLLKIITKIWDDDHGNWALTLLFYVTIMFEFPYRLAVGARNYLYDKGIIGHKKLPCAVISIGNIVVGGTGKTPAVIMLAQLLKEEGFKPAVISRGYGGRSKKPVNIVSDGMNIQAGYREVGDEPVLIAQKNAVIPVITGLCRYAAGEIAINRFGADVIILDDGFQYRSLYRDIDIVLLDSNRPVGNGHLLPSGSLRESLDNLNRGDIFILTGSIIGDNTMPRFLPTFIKDHPSIFHSRHQPLDIKEGIGNRYFPLDFMKGKRVYAFAGIGNPTSFSRTIVGLEALLVGFMTFSDHHNFSLHDIERIKEQARRYRADIILTTEKDGVKLRDYEEFLKNIFMLRIELSFIPNNDSFKKMILQKLAMRAETDASTTQ